MANSSKSLKTLTKEERLLLASVPYRVGVWISDCDDQKTRMDDKLEAQALELAIVKMAKTHRKMPFAAAIMNDVQAMRKSWKEWEQNAAEDVILQDVSRAVAICADNFSSKESSQYKQAVWNIGMVVAQAFGEHLDPDGEMHVDRFFSWMGSFITSPKLSKSPENMSAKEKTALKKLRAVLKN